MRTICVLNVIRHQGVSLPVDFMKSFPLHTCGAYNYTTQFANLIAYYLDLRLPHRLSYSEFRNGDLVNEKFNKKVAKLNANVIHLCSSQGIHGTFLQPRKTVSSLPLLFDPERSDLSRLVAMEDSLEKDLVIHEDANSWSSLKQLGLQFPPFVHIIPFSKFEIYS